MPENRARIGWGCIFPDPGTNRNPGLIFYLIKNG